MGSVSWTWKRGKDEKLYGSKAFETDQDYPSEKDAKRAVESFFAAQECEKCGSRDLGGDNIEVEVTKIDLYREIEKKGFFGGAKMAEEHWKTVHRVGSIFFPNAHIFSSGGHLKCRKCKHRMGSLGFFAQWASNVARGG